MKKTSKHGDLIYDVGMHKGEDTSFYLKKGFKVIAFEADPDLAAHCRNRFAQELKNQSLVIVEGAIVEPSRGAATAKTIKFYRDKDNTMWGTVVDDWADRNKSLGTSNEIIEVAIVDFSAYLEKYGIPHYLKIDIEGMDKVCLRTLLNFDQKPSYVSIESEKLSFDKLVEEFDLFEELGYTGFKAVQQGGISRQREPNPAREGHYLTYSFPEGCSGLFGADLPGRWKNRNQILKEYKIIFLLYRLFGDYGTWNKHIPGKIVRRLLYLISRRHIPGWHDTHARHSTTA